MCEKPIQCYLSSSPKTAFGHFTVCTKQYHEVVQFDKEYLFFSSKYCNKFENNKIVYVPCGKCIQCMYSRSKSWEIRSVFGLQDYSEKCCLTLTYNDEHLPRYKDCVKVGDVDVVLPEEKQGVIRYKDVQDFIKRLRKHFNFRREIKYICSCEYGGTNTLRPHYHIIILNYSPTDISLANVRRSKKGTLLYKSDFLTELWGKGHVDVGKADLQCCRYVSQYCCKNMLKERKTASKYDKLLLKAKNVVARECLHASQGLGLKSFVRNMHNIIEAGCIRFGKFCYGIPKYFLRKLETLNPRLYQIVKQKGYDRWLSFKNTHHDQYEARCRSSEILRKLNLFHSDIVGVLVT